MAKSIIVELSSPNDLLNSLILKIKEKQKIQKLTIGQLSLKAGLSKKTYESFIYNGTGSIINLIKILKALNLISELENLISEIEPSNEKEFKELKKIRAKEALKKSKTTINKKKFLDRLNITKEKSNDV